jgi:glycine/D-amino acid oxidase-like deaminating enzyme
MTSARHTAEGFWLSSVDEVQRTPAARGSIELDVAIIGGGFTGLWTAWHLKQRDPALAVGIFEGGSCGSGASGRNGGILSALWDTLPTLVDHVGADAALSLAEASSDAIRAIGRWCAQEGVDAHYEAHPMLEVATSSAQVGRWESAVKACAALGVADRYRAASAEEIRSHCDSPVFGQGAIMEPAATVDPARLARGLRRRVIDAGVQVYEGSVVDTAEPAGAGVRLRSATFDVRAGSAVLAVNSRAAGWPGHRTRLSVTSSHMVITEPVPEIIERHGWDGAPFVDHRWLLHYCRPTQDGRIAIGWGGGSMGFGGRMTRELQVDAYSTAAAVRGLRRFFPDVEPSMIEHMWGGPIDVSPIHVPVALSRGPIWSVFGYTGNGVSLSYLMGEAVGDAVLGRPKTPASVLLDPPGLPRFPPEPLRQVGGNIIRRALIAVDASEDAGERPGLLARAVAGVPRRLGLNLPR